MEYYTAIKRNELVLHMKTLLMLTGIFCRAKEGQAKKKTGGMISFITKFKNKQYSSMVTWVNQSSIDWEQT